MEMVQPPAMIEKQVKASKAKSEKKVKEAAESPGKEPSPVTTQPAQSLEGKSFVRQFCVLCHLASMRHLCENPTRGQQCVSIVLPA